MKKTIGKSILVAIAMGLLSTSYVLADTLDQSVTTNNSEAASNSKNIAPNVDNISAIIQKPRAQLVGWPLMTQDSARNFKGIVEVTEKLPYEAEAPSYIPFGYQLYTARIDRNDVLEVVYHKQGGSIYQDGKKFITNVMSYRMGYSVDTVRDTAYIPAEYKDFEWSEQGESGEVFYTGDPAAQLIRSITWTKDGMAYSLLFLEPVKAVDAEFYKEHIVPVKSIDSSRYELLGNYPITKTSTKTIDEYNKELMERYRWYDQLDNGDIVHHNVDASTNDFGYDLQIPSYMPKDYAVRDVKAKDHDVLEIVYTETGRNGEYGPKLTFSNTDIVYRMGWAIDTVVKPILEKTKYNAKDAVSFTTPNGISVHTLSSSKDAIQIAYWEKDNKVYMLYFASLRTQDYVSKIVDSVGSLSNVASDDTRLRGDRNDKQHVEENDAKNVKQNDEPDWPHYETIGLPWRTVN